MLKVVVVAAVALVALSAAARGSDLLGRTSLVGGCSAIVTPEGQDGSWLACRAGRLEGRPDLSLKSCTTRGFVRELELWRCPEPLVGSRVAA